MEVYINDLSFSFNSNILAEWDKVKKFNDLLKEIQTKFNVSIIAPKHIWHIPLCGFNLNTKTTEVGATIPKEREQFLIELFKRFSAKVEGEPLFSMTNAMFPSSSSVGTAAEKRGLVISLTFDSRFAEDKIEGWLKQNNCQPEKSCVSNLSDKEQTKNYIYLTDISRCHTINPTKEPLWNKELSEKILQGVDFINVAQEERKSLLISYGKLIAEVNGWKYNAELSKLNTTKEHIRYIYDSCTNFTSYPPAFLSIDLEGPEVCYELCDKRGHHLGERSWDGKEKDSKNNHGIIVK